MAATRRSYDAVAGEYASELSAELDGKPLDRTLLDAVAEMAGGGCVADLGGGPGHVAAYLAGRGAGAVEVDLSPGMCVLARRTAGVPAAAGDMGALPVATSSLSAIICMYAVIHLDAAERSSAYREFARVLCPGGHALVAFHVFDDDHATGGAINLTQWFEHEVDLTFRFLDPGFELEALNVAGLEFVARLDRGPYAGAEHPSHRCYLLVRRPR